MTNYAENSDKFLSKAIPTVKTNGIVKKWEIEITYSYPAVGYSTSDTPLRRTYSDTENVEYLGKTLEEYTKAELLNLANLSQYNLIFNSTYESVVLPPKEIRLDSFDINTLA